MSQPPRTRLASVALLITLAGASGCGPKQPAADVVVQIEGSAVPYAEFEVYLASNAIVDAPSLGSDVLSSLFDQFLDEILLARLAADEGYQAGSSRQAVARLIAESSVPVSSAEVEAYFRANRERYRRSESIRLRQILVEERSKAEQALRELEAGAGFEEVARRVSEGPRAEQGGDQGILTREDLPPEIASQVFELDEAEISAIVPAEYGFHIFQVAQRFPESVIALEEAFPEIVELLSEETRAESQQMLLERARKRYNTTLFARNLPFRYQGNYG